MRIHHLAIWTFRLEAMKEFYTRYFKGISNEKYINPKKGFESYFIRFEGGIDLELMSRPDVQNTPVEENRLGLTRLTVKRTYYNKLKCCVRLDILLQVNLALRVTDTLRVLYLILTATG